MTSHSKIWLLAGALALLPTAAGALEIRGDSLSLRGASLEPPAVPSVDLLDVPALGRLLGIAPTTSPLEAQLLDDAADGRLDDWPLAQAALVAGGVRDRTALADYQARLQLWIAAARANDRRDQPARRRAEALLTLMHARIMTRGYQLDATELATLIDGGHFNCVSATVLYMTLAAELGLNVTAVELPTHAFCRVTDGSDTFDVEPTCRRWFEVIDDPQARAAVTRQIAGASRDGAAVPRTVSPAQLLAVIYYNRGVDLIRRGDDTAAIAANLRAMALDPDSATARGNLWVAVNNAALARCRDAEFSAAADLIGRARQAVPHHAALKANELFVFQQWSAELCRHQRLAEALSVLDTGLVRQPGNGVLTFHRQDIERQLSQASGGR